jgi:aspartate aminotransferase
VFTTLIDPGDKVIFPVPSWNNNHYCHLLQAQPVLVETSADNHFMPTASELKPHIRGARMIALCSPLNPTGTVFRKEDLEEICDLIIEENKRRGADEKPLYLMYDQIYWVLTHGDVHHYNPVSLRPAMRDYTVFVDGLSKAFAATGIRVGWAMGPAFMIDKMKSILSHIGAWAPKAEQVATANYMKNIRAMDEFILRFKKEIEDRLQKFYHHFDALNKEGFPVNAIPPEAAMYLTVQFNLKGMQDADGSKLRTTDDITSFVLNKAKMALVPFSSFGSSPDSTWYRLSVGTCRLEEIDGMMGQLRKALSGLN